MHWGLYTRRHDAIFRGSRISRRRSTTDLQLAFQVREASWGLEIGERASRVFLEGELCPNPADDSLRAALWWSSPHRQFFSVFSGELAPRQSQKVIDKLCSQAC
ncbi:hypothetical protein V2G26_002941 [Clonostachys chloroleuca]